MHAGAGWTLEWDDVIEWALRGDPKLKKRCDKLKYTEDDESEQHSLCAVKLTDWFRYRHGPFNRLLDAIVTSDSAGETGFLIIMRYFGEDAGGTLKKFKKFRELPVDVQLREEIATALGISEKKFKWISVVDPYEEDKYRFLDYAVNTSPE
ncbi:hypothetical protein Clacol_004187 [Clathrus columnatus]|uniref:Uncharacterized protein n=1 Tax=Clathrus columnatus TaxID=1419009 RepID=A0AAV5A5T8_9AGAM|nr:hypothetical protein Clacol_004187 [Clathrus columnatus]